MKALNEHWQMISSHYKRVFDIRWGETWYASVVQPLVMSAYENEEFRKKNEEKFYFKTNEEWRPYELIIETQVGLVLVLCQSYITNVISQVHNFHSDFRVLFKDELTGFKTSKSDLLKSFSSYYENTGYTKIEAIDHLANYFKHHQEWGGKPELLTKNAKRTADAVRKLGLDIQLSLWYSRNLSKAVCPLGVSAPQQLPALLTIIDDWKREIGLAYKSLLEVDSNARQETNA